MLELLVDAEVYAPAPLGRRNLLIGGGTILWMGQRLPALDPELPVNRVELHGMRLFPGLIDGHVHVTGGGGEAGFRSRVPPTGPSLFTQSGVTSVVGVLGTDDLNRSTRELVAQTLALREDGLNAWCHCGGYHIPLATLTGSVRGDIVHIDPIIGVGELALSDHRSSQPTLDELLRIASEAHVAGLMANKAGVVHLHLGDGPRGLAMVRQALETSELPARVFNPTHCNRRRALFDEAMALADQGCSIDVTAFPVADGEDAWTAEDALLRYLEAGLPPSRITVSSDGGGCLPTFDVDGDIVFMDVGRPQAMALTLRRLLERGAPMERVLPAFTTNVARLLRLPGKGVIRIGADADLVAMDPQFNITDVMIRGRWHRRESKPVRHGLFEGGER
mgnify:CR=1 FL=1